MNPSLRPTRWRAPAALLIAALLAAGLLAACGGGGGGGTSSTDGGSGGVTITAPAIVTPPVSASVVSGGTATFSVGATGSAPLAYQWRLDGSAIAGATAASYSAGVAGSYTVTVSNSAGSVTSAAATLTVTTPTTPTAETWNLDTGANPLDAAERLSFQTVSLALDTLTVSTASSRLQVSGSIGAAGSGSAATVALDGSAAVTISRDAYGLVIRSTAPAATPIALALSGAFAGGITVYSDQPYQLALNGAALAATDGPALNLQSKQRAFVVLGTGSANTLADTGSYSARTLADGSAMDLKATLFAEGPVIVSGAGSLAVTAASKHALASDAHVRLRSGTLSLTAVKKDGLRANQAFVMDGGALTIRAAAGKGIKVDGKESTVQALGFIAINDGVLDITSHDKAITAAWEGAEDGDTTTTADDPDPRVTINGGRITIVTTGTPYEDRNTADGDDSLAPEGIEAKSTLTLNGGNLTVNTTDDALNAGTAIVINGGRLYARSSVNDAIDSNGTITISGGVVVADGANRAEGGLDCDNGRFAITGGWVVGIGGRNSLPTLAATTQNSATLRTVSAGTVVLRDAAGNAAFAFTMPENSTSVVLTTPLLATGTRYTLVTGGTVATGAESFHGLVLGAATHSGGTAGTSATVASTVTSF